MFRPMHTHKFGCVVKYMCMFFDFASVLRLSNQNKQNNRDMHTLIHT